MYEKAIHLVNFQKGDVRDWEVKMMSNSSTPKISHKAQNHNHVGKKILSN